jgi:hypothetical protein
MEQSSVATKNLLDNVLEKIQMTTEKIKDDVKLVFAPGCFDSFEGTQEELDALIADINRMVESGELFENSQPLDIDSLDEDEMVAVAAALGINVDDAEMTAQPKNRILQ